MNADQLLSVNIAMAEYNATRKEEFPAHCGNIASGWFVNISNTSRTDIMEKEYPVRNEVWHWIFTDDFRASNFRSYVMDDFGTLVPIT